MLRGGPGEDTLKGEDGNDRDTAFLGTNAGLFGEAGDDDLFGGRDDDALDGGIDNDLLHGEEGDDSLNGRDGNDVLYGDAGDDELLGSTGSDYLNTVDTDVNNDSANGGSSTDICPTDPDPRQSCEYSVGFAVASPALKQYLLGQSADIQFSTAAAGGSAEIEEFLVREPDGDFCVAPRLTGMVVPPGFRLAPRYPDEFQLSRNDQPRSGDNRCATALEGTYGINVRTQVRFGRATLPESFKSQFEVAARR